MSTARNYQYVNCLTAEERNLLFDLCRDGVFTPFPKISKWSGGKFYFSFMFTSKEDFETTVQKNRSNMPKWLRENSGEIEVYKYVERVCIKLGEVEDNGRMPIFEEAAQELMREAG